MLTAKAKAQEKIQELVDSGKITAEYGKELSAKAVEELDALFAKIDEYYAKYKGVKGTQEEENLPIPSEKEELPQE